VAEKYPHIVEVVWEDAWSNSTKYYTREELDAEQPLVLHSVGYLLKDDKSGVALTVEHNPQGEHSRHIMFIPRGMIRKMVKLRKPQPRKRG